MPHIVDHRFDDNTYVAGLKVRPHPYWIRIQQCRHVGVGVTQAGKPYWHARYRRKNGRYKERRIAPVSGFHTDGITFEEAKSLAVQWFRTPKIRRDASEARPLGGSLKLNYCPYGPIYSVGHALNEYIERLLIMRTPDAVQNAVSAINYHLVETVSDIPVESFTGKDLEKLAMHVLTKPPRNKCQHSTIRIPISSLSSKEVRMRKARLNYLISILRTSFRLAWENGRVESERPWRCLRSIPVVHKPRTIFLNRSDCTSLLEACNPALKKLVLAGLYTGCRVSELGALKVGDVANGGYGIYVRPIKRKNARFVFLPDEGMAFFLSCCQGKAKDDYVFLSDRGIPWRHQHKHHFKVAVRKSGLPKEFVFHGLRHTYASQLVRAGVGLEIIARQLGHSGTRTVAEVYGHLTEKFREDEVRRAFLPLCSEFANFSRERFNELELMRSSFQQADWRNYPNVPDSPDLPTRRHILGNVELDALFERLLGR